MKRTFAMILALLMLLSLAGCGGKEDNMLKLGLLEIESQGGHKEHEATVHADRFGVSEYASAFSKTSLNIRKFTFHILPKPGLENFEHYFTSV